MNLLSYDGLRERGILLSKVQIWRLEKAGKFPRRVRISAARIAWVASEIDAYLAKRVAERESAE